MTHAQALNWLDFNGDPLEVTIYQWTADPDNFDTIATVIEQNSGTITRSSASATYATIDHPDGNVYFMNQGNYLVVFPNNQYNRRFETRSDLPEDQYRVESEGSS